MARRSVLFTPGDEAEMMRKSVKGDADAVVFDLEDAVAPLKKDEARKDVREILDEVDGVEKEICVRVNSGKECQKDVNAITSGVEPDTVVVPKVGKAEDVKYVARLLSANGSEAGILALIETAKGVLNASEIAETPPIDGLVFGAEDFSADVGATRTEEGDEVLYARQKVVVAASAADVDAIDTLHTDFRDDEGLRNDTEFGIQLGYDGKLAIHPAQVEVINNAFTPSDERIEWAEKVLRKKEKAEKEGKGVFEVEGEMIDSPLIEQAKTVMERAEAAGIR